MTPRVGFLSFRFGATDGVSVVARTWMTAFESFGYEVTTITGDSDADRTVPGIGLPDGFDRHDTCNDDEPDVASTDGGDVAALSKSLGDALADLDLVVVENLLTIPLNLRASRVTARLLRGRRAVLHHHDPPWHRDRFAHITELPAGDPGWLHIAVTSILAKELAERGIESTVIHNGFPAPEPRDPTQRDAIRSATRSAIGLDCNELVVAHPVRAIERKNIPAAINLAERLGATYWLLGPAEEGYGAELDRLLQDAGCRVVHREWPDPEGIYAAADLIAFPSTWEGFGNPPIEASLYRKPVVVGSYPVADELRAYGFEWFRPDEHERIRSAVHDPDGVDAVARADNNERIALAHFSVDRVRDDLAAALGDRGWLS